jgi:hypothetical protein
MLVAILEEDRSEALIGSGPALELIVVRFGQDRREGRGLRVLVHLRLPAVGDRRGQVAAVDDGHGAVELGSDLGRLRLDLVSPRLEEGRGRVDLGADAGGDPGEGGCLGGGGKHVSNGHPRLEDPRQADDGNSRLSGLLDELATGADDQPLRPERLGGLEAGEGLLGVAGVAGAEDRPLGRRPARQLVAADRDQRLG